MNILSYGVKQPQTGDKGSVFFPALEDDLEYLNDHTHDGTEGAPIPATNIQAVKQNILAASWLSVSDGYYRQLLTVANGKNYDDVDVSFRITSTGEPLYLNLEKVSSTTYYVYINDSSLAITAYYRG
jgi:hypothetical protein